MTAYITLAFRESPDLMPMSKTDDGGIVAFVFSNSDDAIAWANQHLPATNHEWITNTHNPESIRAWTRMCAVENGVTEIAVSPDTARPRIMPIAVFQAMVDLLP